MKLIDEIKSKKTPVIPAPLAGYLDPAQATILVMLGVRHMFYPFISSEGMVKRPQYRKQVSEKLKTWRDVVPDGCVHYQIFGRDPAIMAETATYLADFENADLIDLNMGCSVKKVLKAESGSHLLKDLPRALKIVESVLDSVSVPVTVKTRIGWDNDENGMALIRESSRMGVTSITLHPRYGKQNFSGVAQWDYIRQAVESVDVPVVGNGDVLSDDDALKMVNQTGCAGVMIGRSSIGNPWIFNQSDSLINEGKKLGEPSDDDRVALCIEHIGLMVKYRGEVVGVKESRKHVGRYLRGMPGASAVRQIVVQESKFENIRDILTQYRNRLLEIKVGEDDGES